MLGVPQGVLSPVCVVAADLDGLRRCEMGFLASRCIACGDWQSASTRGRQGRMEMIRVGEMWPGIGGHRPAPACGWPLLESCRVPAIRARVMQMRMNRASYADAHCLCHLPWRSAHGSLFRLVAQASDRDNNTTVTSGCSTPGGTARRGGSETPAGGGDTAGGGVGWSSGLLWSGTKTQRPDRAPRTCRHNHRDPCIFRT